MIITLHDNGISELGTSVAIYDYAEYLQKDHTIFIAGNRNHPSTSSKAISFFQKKFNLLLYTELSELWELLKKNKTDIFYCIKGGQFDNVLAPPPIKTIVHCTGLIVYPHGDLYLTVSKTLSDLRGASEPVLNHMINLPECSENYRKVLGIPENATVISRYGGTYSFDIPFVRRVIQRVIQDRSDIYFLLINVDRFIDDPRVIHFEVLLDRVEKVKFINTSDAMLHARVQGESFGLAIGEFSTKGKRVITWSGSQERNHINILGNKGIYYYTEEDLYSILMNFNRETIDLKAAPQETLKTKLESLMEVLLTFVITYL